MKGKIIALILLAAIWGTQTLTVVSQDKDTYLSEEIQGYCVEIGEKYGVCPELIMAMIEKESSGNPKAENDGCCGLMQISTKYHSDRMERLGVTDIYDPYGNISCWNGLPYGVGREIRRYRLRLRQVQRQ